MTRPISYLYNAPTTTFPDYRDAHAHGQAAANQEPEIYSYETTVDYGQGYLPHDGQGYLGSYAQAYNAPVAGTVIAGQDRSVLNSQPFGAGLSSPPLRSAHGGDTTVNALSPLAEYAEPQEDVAAKPPVAEFDVESVAPARTNRRRVIFWVGGIAGVVLAAGAVAGGVLGTRGLNKGSGNGTASNVPAAGTTSATGSTGAAASTTAAGSTTFPFSFGSTAASASTTPVATSRSSSASRAFTSTTQSTRPTSTSTSTRTTTSTSSTTSVPSTTSTTSTSSEPTSSEPTSSEPVVVTSSVASVDTQNEGGTVTVQDTATVNGAGPSSSFRFA